MGTNGFTHGRWTMKKLAMKYTMCILICLAGLALAPGLWADSVYNITGTATLLGTDCPSCSENFTFSLQVSESLYPTLGFVYLSTVPGTGQISASGDLPPDVWSVAVDSSHFYGTSNDGNPADDNSTWQRIVLDDQGGDDIEIVVSTPGPGPNSLPQIMQGIEMYSCGTLAACSDFGFTDIPPQAGEFGNTASGPAQITVSPALAPEPSSLALLAAGMLLFSVKVKKYAFS